MMVTPYKYEITYRRKSWGPSIAPSTATPRRRNRPAIHNFRSYVRCPSRFAPIGSK
jgi:hypothetical protein